jgi:tetratricopeptide (TPR) repeat protein
MLKKKTSLNIRQLLQPSVRLDDGLKTIKENKSALSPKLSGYLSRKAHEFISINDLETGEKLYRWAVAIGETIENQRSVAYCSYDLAELLENANKPSESVEFYKKALPFYLNNRDLKEIYRIFHRTAICFIKANQVDRAINELKRADETMTSIGLRYNSKLNIYPFLIERLEEQNRVKEANDAKKILSVAQQRLNRIEILRPKFEKALKIGQKGNIKIALELYKEIYHPFMENCDLADRISLLLNMGGTLSDAAEYKEATLVLKKAVQICKSINVINGEASVRKNMASNYEDQGRYQEALEVKWTPLSRQK